jgi:hypothetical protein
VVGIGIAAIGFFRQINDERAQVDSSMFLSQDLNFTIAWLVERWAVASQETNIVDICPEPVPMNMENEVIFLF